MHEPYMTHWTPVIEKLRTILLDCGLTEQQKWGKPCFVHEGSNVAIIQPFKQMCALMFFKGALLQDTHGLLRSQGENSQSALRLEFTDAAQVKRAVVKSYVKQAIAVEQAGLRIAFTAKHELDYPEELIALLEQNGELDRAFRALTPGRQRAYLLHFNGVKQSATRISRIEKCLDRILAGKGLADR
jgi:uncharacterized protein YdeI (YjbR/CyaY-like superfamily)